MLRECLYYVLKIFEWAMIKLFIEISITKLLVRIVKILFDAPNHGSVSFVIFCYNNVISIRKVYPHFSSPGRLIDKLSPGIRKVIEV